MEIDLTNSELFKSFAEFEHDGFYTDLHNEFDCKSIAFAGNKTQLKLLFEPNEYCTLKVRCVEVVFEGCGIEQFPDKLITYPVTLDTIYRGRFEINSEKLSEVSDNGQFYYYINFLPDMEIELFAKNVLAKLRDK